MPYRGGMSAELQNTTGSPIDVESARLEYDPTPPPADAGCLHAVYRQERTKPKQEYHVLLEASGSGHYVGNLLYFYRIPGGQPPLEGDDIIVVNPGKPHEQVLHGTGLEDANNGGFHYNHSELSQINDKADPLKPASGLASYHGLLQIQLADPAGPGSSTRVDQYRWMIGDLVPFNDGIVVKIENYAAAADVLFGSTAFYYATPEAGPADSNGQSPAIRVP